MPENLTTYVTLAVVPDRNPSAAREGRGYVLPSRAVAQRVASHVTTALPTPEPLTPEQARPLVDADGYATVVVTADLEDLIAAAVGRFTQCEDDEHDYLHRLAFAFGEPHDSRYRVLAAGDAGGLLIEYATLVNA